MLEAERLRVGHAAIAVWGVRLLGYAVSVGVSILIARALGPEGRGQYYFPILVASTLFGLLHVGAEHAHIFLVGQGRSVAALAANAGVLAAGAGLAGIGLGLAGWLWLHDTLMSGLPLGLLALALAPLPLSLHHLYLAGLLVLRGEVVRVHRITLWGGLFQALAVAALVAGGGVSVPWVVGVNTAAVALTWALTLGLFRSLVPLRLGWDGALFADTLRFGLRVHVGMVLSFRSLRPDGYLVKHFLGLRELGYYSLAVSLVELVLLAADSIAFVVLPRQTRAGVDDAATLTTRTCRVSLVVGTLLSAALAAAAYPLVRVAYGTDFLPALPALWLLLPGIVVASLWRPLGGYLLKLGQPLALSATSGVALLVHLALTLLLVPAWGIAGAAVATTAAYGALAAVSLAWFLRRAGVAPDELLRIRSEGAGMWRFVRRDLFRFEKP
jgi:O-antigen/teichoic acid export membrane protein